MPEYTAILFDLDGTIVDSAPGITATLAYTFEQLGRPVPSPAELVAYVGPPILDSFRERGGMTHAQAEEALDVYRPQYLKTGVFDATIYPGIPALLKKIHESGIPLSLATSKPEAPATLILEHYDLLKYFTIVTGPRTTRPAAPRPTSWRKLSRDSPTSARTCRARSWWATATTMSMGPARTGFPRSSCVGATDRPPKRSGRSPSRTTRLSSRPCCWARPAGSASGWSGDPGCGRRYARSSERRTADTASLRPRAGAARRTARAARDPGRGTRPCSAAPTRLMWTQMISILTK